MQKPDADTTPVAGPIAASYAHWAHALHWRDLPAEVVAQGQHLILDALGIALASGRYPFAQQTFLAMQDLCPSTGPVPVFGLQAHLPARDAALINGFSSGLTRYIRQSSKSANLVQFPQCFHSRNLGGRGQDHTGYGHGNYLFVD